MKNKYIFINIKLMQIMLNLINNLNTFYNKLMIKYLIF